MLRTVFVWRRFSKKTSIIEELGEYLSQNHQISTIRVLARQEVTKIVTDTSFQFGEWFVIPCRSQPPHLGFGKILVFVDELCRHVDVFDNRGSMGRGKHRVRKVLPAACPTGADIKKSVDRRIL